MEIRKTKYIAALIVFLLSSVGVWVNKHYSNGQLYDVSFFAPAKSCCATHCHCCDEETIVYQLSTETINANTLQISKVQDYEWQISVVFVPKIKQTNSLFLQHNSSAYLYIADTSPGVLQVFRC